MDLANRSVDGMGRYGSPKTKVEFSPPKNLDLQGESGEALVKWRKKDGKICILSMDGVALPGYDEAEKEDEA